MKTDIKKLIYVFDPLCGWCYGFSPVVVGLWEATRDKVNWDVIPGGMVVGENVGPIGRIAGFITASLPRLESTTGVTLGKGFKEGVLEEGSMVLSSLEPARALVAAKLIDSSLAVPFAAALQEELYQEGHHIGDEKVLSTLADKFFIKEFSSIYHDPLTLERTENEFKLAASWGVKGYPTLLGIKDGVGTVFNRGWASLDRVLPAVEHWMNN